MKNAIFLVLFSAMFLIGCAGQNKTSLVRMDCTVYESGHTIDAETYAQFPEMAQMLGSFRTCNLRDLRLAKMLSQISSQTREEIAVFLHLYSGGYWWSVKDHSGNPVKVYILNAYLGLYEEWRHVVWEFDDSCQQISSCCKRQISDNTWECKNNAFCM